MDRSIYRALNLKRNESIDGKNTSMDQEALKDSIQEET